MDLAPGTYMIAANSIDPQTGNYTLETTFPIPAIPTSYAIGDTGPAGGIVFYVTNGGINGLEAAPVDQIAAAWGCNGAPPIAGADGTAIGTGAQNTADIIAGCTDVGIAAKLADAYTFNDFSDWFLPSKDELSELFLQQFVVGGLGMPNYWSSSEISSTIAWNYAFPAGPEMNTDTKNLLFGVRPIRAF